MSRTVVAAAALLLVALPASASFIEDTLAPAGLGLHYQEDAGVAGDAPATCDLVDPRRELVIAEGATNGLLMQSDDDADVYAFELGEDLVGQRVSVNLLTGLAVDLYDIAFDVLSPDCASSVFDPESAYYDAAPDTPYEPPLGSATFEAGLTGYDCNSSQWKFLGNQMGGIPAPADIYVEWTNGDWEYVPVVKSTPATIAMYTTSSTLDVTVARAVIVLPATYTGQFNLVHGPCDAAVGTPEPEPFVSARYGNFTVQEAGLHVALVYMAKDIPTKTQETVEGLLDDPPTSVPANCHRDLCSAALSFVSYDLGSEQAS